MRNLKKVLAMVLALIMSLSLMTVAASAAETTAAAASGNTAYYKTAQEVLEGLSVFKGDAESGAMRYDQPINRAETAALVYRVHTADVNDTQAGIYTNCPFTDVAQNHWGRSYISYAYNAEIVKGTNAEQTQFDPDDNVTGYQVLAMVLRTLGYGRNHEFEGPGWEVQTAATAKQIGLLEGVTAADENRLGSEAQRGLVAQILFNSLLQKTVKFSALNPYNYEPVSDQTLGEIKFKMEELNGVITANEYADLYNTSVLPEGRTNVLANGVNHVIEHSSNLDNIGENILAYVKGGKVLSVTEDTTEYPEIFDETSVTAFLNKNNLKKNSDTESFINFGPGTNWKSDWKIKYTITIEFNKVALTGNDTATTVLWNNRSTVNRAIQDFRDINGFKLNLPVYDYDQASKTYNYAPVTVVENGVTYVIGAAYSVEFPIKEDITPYHQTNIETIFNIADRERGENGYFITGEVYVGTTSAKDISDEKSLDQFMAEYIKTDDQDPVSSNENGNWLKVIDNDGDGYVDYILETVYTFARVSDMRNDTYTLDTKNEALDDDDAINMLTTQPVSAEDEIAVGDVVYYAVIDGVARTYKAATEIATIEQVAHDGSYAITTEGTKHEASGVHEHILDAVYKSTLTQLAGRVTYDLYFDRGDHLGVFVEHNTEHGFKLVLDGWFNSTKTGYEYAMKFWDDEAKKVSDPVDINSTASRFIGKDVLYWDPYTRQERQTDNNDWNALKYLGDVVGSQALNDGPRQTAVAAGSPTTATLNGGRTMRSNQLKTTVVALTSDDGVLPVDNTAVDNRGQYYMIDMTDNAIPTADRKYGDVYTTSLRSETAYDHLSTSHAEVRAVNSTVYYTVYKDGYGYHVLTATGYSNAPSYDADDIEDVYVVATSADRTSSVGNQDGNNQYDSNGHLIYTPEYYIAEIVVIELSNFEQSKVPVLVYDSPYVYSNVLIDRVKMIDNTGADVEVNIDLQNSYDLDHYMVEYGSAGTKKLLPGLYWRKPTNTDDLYTLERMTRAEIAQNFTVGQIYTGKQSNRSWIDVSLMTTTDPDFNSRGYYTQGVVRGNAPVEFTPSGGEHLYNLAYGKVGYGEASLTPVSDSEAFSEQVNYSTIFERKAWYDGDAWELVDNDPLTNTDGSDYINIAPGEGDMKWYGLDDEADAYNVMNGRWDYGEKNWNKNNVLIYASGKNIIYAVSFEHMTNENTDMRDWTESGTNIDYAQTVWFNCLGAPASTPSEAAAPSKIVITSGTGSNEVDLRNGVDQILTLEYSEWHNKTLTLKVTPTKGNQIAFSDSAKWADVDTVIEKTLNADGSGAPETIVVMVRGADNNAVSKSFTITVNYKAPNNDATLKAVAGKGVEVRPNGEIGPLATVTDFDKWPVKDFITDFLPADKNASVVWTVNKYSEGEEPIIIEWDGEDYTIKAEHDLAGLTMESVKSMTVLVTAEDGTEQTYTYTPAPAPDAESEEEAKDEAGEVVVDTEVESDSEETPVPEAEIETEE